MGTIIERIIYNDDGSIEKIECKIPVTAQIDGKDSKSAVMNILGWRLVMEDQKTHAVAIFFGGTEQDMLALKTLLENIVLRTTVKINFPLDKSEQ